MLAHRGSPTYFGCSFILIAALIAVSAPNKGEVDGVYILFERFETVVRADAALVNGSRTLANLPKGDSNPTRQPFLLLIRALDSLASGTSSYVLDKAVAVMVGARNFAPPAGLGPTHSESCYIVILKRDVALDLRKHVKAGPVRSVSTSKTPRWQWTANLGEFGELDSRPSSMSAAQIDNTHLIVCNTTSEIGAIVDELSSSAQSSVALETRPVWREIRSREVWGYRQYRQNLSGNKRSAPGEIGSGVRSLAFWVDQSKNSFTLRLDCIPGKENGPANINAMALFGRLVPRADGIWERTLPLEGGEESTGERLGALMDLLGFAAYP